MSRFPYPVPPEVATSIDGARSILLLTHENPDADGVGSLLGMGLALVADGREVRRVSLDDLAPGLAELAGFDSIPAAEPGETFDLGILFDAHRRARVGSDLPLLERCARSLAIDHHPPTDAGCDLDLSWVVPSAPSSTMLVLAWMLGRDVAPDAAQAGALYAGLLTDTGGFRHANSTSDAFHAAAQLVDAGADPEHLSFLLMRRRRPAALDLLSESLQSTRYLLDGRLAVMVVDQACLERTGAVDHECEGLVGYVDSVEGVEIAALCRELEDGSWRVSLRARADRRVDLLAGGFDGGGHHRAAAFAYTGSLTSLESQLVESVRACLADGACCR